MTASADRPGARRAGGALRGHGAARRLGHVRQERDGRDDPRPDGRPGRHTRKRAILAAAGSYHGAAPWCNPWPRRAAGRGQGPHSYFRYNDLETREGGGCSGGRRPRRRDRDAVPARRRPRSGGGRSGLRPRSACALCDEAGAALILDDVRCGLPPRPRGQLGADRRATRPERVGEGDRQRLPARRPCWGRTRSAGRRQRIFTTGSFWFSSVSMAASVATITTVHAERAHETMARIGRLLRDGIASQAAEHGVAIKQTGPGAAPEPLLRRRRALRAGARLRRRVRPPRGVRPPQPQLVPELGAHRGRRRPHTRGDGPRVRPRLGRSSARSDAWSAASRAVDVSRRSSRSSGSCRRGSRPWPAPPPRLRATR